MKTAICFYFQVHQPFRIRRDYSFFHIGPDHNYLDEKSNREIMEKVSNRCYLPANRTLLELIKEHDGKFKVAFSISGVALEQFELYEPEVLKSFQELVATGHVEILGETYYHSLAFVKSQPEFVEQVELHKEKIKKLFGVVPTTFRNTELIYNNDLAKLVEQMGFVGVLAEGTDKTLQWRTPNAVYRPKGCEEVKVLLKNYKLSDDIAFRFSNKKWKDYPLTAQKYLTWLQKACLNGQTINLFMDYETFGEHQKEQTGIFNFLRELPSAVLSTPNLVFKTPSEVCHDFDAVGVVDVPEFTSWADVDRDLSAWLGNSMQESGVEYVYSLEEQVKNLNDPMMTDLWRKFQTSDHHYYASTKGLGDGDVHNYFNHFSSPHDAYIVYTNVLNDFKLQLSEKLRS